MLSKKGNKEIKRVSTRVRTLSAAMRRVDEDTRREYQNRRLMMLEADNFVEEQEVAVLNEDAYGESDDDSSGLPKKKRIKSQSSSSLSSNSKSKSKWAERRIKSLERMIMEQGYTNEGSVGEDGQIIPNYLSIAAEASSIPARHFCSVCGYIGKYSCVRCGLRFCSIRCNENHKETRCMKFSI